jgi:hypothetical protein
VHLVLRVEQTLATRGSTQKLYPSCSRRVRIVAGDIVADSALASTWFPRMHYLAGTIGAGLTMAAVTDTCAMDVALSALPDNRGGARSWPCPPWSSSSVNP